MDTLDLPFPISCDIIDKSYLLMSIITFDKGMVLVFTFGGQQFVDQPTDSSQSNAFQAEGA
jgi:hypothetical protein